MKRNKAVLTIHYFFLSLIFFFIFLQPALPEENSLSSPILTRINSCKLSLVKPSYRKWRSNWLSCIALEKRLYYDETSPEEVRREALSDLIDLYHRLGRFSGKKSDQEKENYWRKIRSDLSPDVSHAVPISNSIYNLRSSVRGNILRIVLDVKNRAIYEIREKKESDFLQVAFLNTTPRPELERKSYSLHRGEMKAELQSVSETTELSISNIRYESFRISQLPNPNRWIIDMHLSEKALPSSSTADPDLSVPSPKKTLEDIHPPSQGVHKIIIDPGHGGKDPGAIGSTGYSEKDAVLDIGLRLKKLLLKDPKLDVIMTRSKDIFIPLGERTRIANDANADLFISIHANSSPHRTSHGIEIYLLGQSSDRRALRTAARENNVTEEEASHMDKNLLSIEKDLSQEYKKEESLELAHITRSSFLNRLRPSYPVVDLGVKSAPFYVLMNTTMPSILAEVSFISNPAEEQRLKNKSYRQIMAESLLEGIKKFMAANSNSASF